MDTQEQIRNRILRMAARQWGYQESEMDLEAFDPLVRLLVEACSGEVARLERLLVDAEDRILERMLEQLSPEVLTGPLPAHAVATVRPLRHRLTIGTDLQAYLTPDSSDAEPVYFSPLVDTEVIDATVAYLELGGQQLVQVGEQRQRIAAGTSGHEEFGSSLWIGIKLGADVKELTGLHCYFNWLNVPELEDKLEWLRRARWTCGGYPLRVRRGGTAQREQRGPVDVADFLQAEYSRHQRSVARILDAYAPHLYTIEGMDTDGASLQQLLQPYPEEFKRHYAAKELAKLKQELLWIKVGFPTQFNHQDLQLTTCVLNPVIVANLRHHRHEARLRDTVNIVPLSTDHHYFDLLQVRSRKGTAYHEVPLTNVRDYAAGQYSVRRRDTGRFGEREASRALLNLLDALRDESAAFSAYGKDALDSKIKRLNQQLKDLEQQVNSSDTNTMGNLAFLLVRPLERDHFLEVNYLSTQAERGNGFIAGQELDLLRFAGIDRKSLRLVTTTGGGRQPLSSQDRKYAYKKAIISRGRIVSREDIRAFCEAEFGDAVAGGVHIGKQVVQGRGPKRGLERVMLVSLELPEPESADAAAKLSMRLAELERELNRQSSGVLPLRVQRAANSATTGNAY